MGGQRSGTQEEMLKSARKTIGFYLEEGFPFIGFAPASHFARCYREAYGATPSVTRRQALRAA